MKLEVQVVDCNRTHISAIVFLFFDHSSLFSTSPWIKSADEQGNKVYALLHCGGGPAGMTLGYLRARARVEVLVLGKHGDFLGGFRRSAARRQL